MSGPPRRLAAVPDGRGPAEFGRQPPHSISVEQAVLGAIMLSPRALAEVRGVLDGSEFYRPAHQVIWEAITALADRGAPTDPLAVGAELGRDLAKTGGAPYLHTLIEAVPAAANGGYYARMVADLAYARRVIETGARLAQMGHAAAGGEPCPGDLRAAVAAACAAVTERGQQGWPDPVPLASVTDLPAFPLGAFPAWLGEYAAALAEATQTPPDLAGCLSLAVLAVAAGGKIWVAAPLWREPACLFTVVVMPPGSRKSEVFAAMTAPLRSAEQTLIEAARPVIAEAVVRRRLAEAAAERTARAAETTQTGPDPDAATTAVMEATEARLAVDDTDIPAAPCLFSDDATVEALASLLAGQGGRFAVLSPEGEILAIAAGRYSAAPSFGVFKSGHAGETIRIDRKGRPPDHIEHAVLTLGICTQPGVLARLGDVPQFREQGLLGRMLYSVPDSLMGWRKENPDPIPAHTHKGYHAHLSSLVLSLAALDQPADLTFTPAAAAAVTAMLADTEPRFRPGTGDLAHMTDWGGKLVGATVRIVGLLHLATHLADGWAQPIAAETFGHARRIGDYFTAHAQSAYDTIGDPAVANARALLAWARNTGTSRFTTSDILASLRHGPLEDRPQTVEGVIPQYGSGGQLPQFAAHCRPQW